MKQGVLRRFLSLVLIASLVMLYLPAEGVKAATDLNVGVSGLSASYDGGSWSRSGTTITGTAVGTTESGCSGDTNSATISTLTLTNNSGSAAVLSFAYERQQSGGTITIDSAQVSSGTFSKGLANGESIQIVLKSGEGKTYTVSVSITGLSLETEKNVTTTFVPAANGSFSYNGTTVSSETQNTQLSSVAYKLSASAGSGYKFLGWYSQSKSSYISFDNPAMVYFDENQRITAVFVPSASAVFTTGGAVFTDLNEAISYAQSKGYSLISLMSSGTLPSGNYSIPAGKTLLIPFDAGNTLYTTKPEVIYGSHATPVHFRTLTMASGAAITVENGGAISVGSKLSATGQNAASWNGTPTGSHGFISMQSGSAITLKNGGNLYVYGYIGGSGSVEALSGSVVYETFQIRCWRGGSATSNMTSGVFPMSQYYVQNIEVPLTIHYGATEMVYSSANANSSAYPISATFIGNSGLFRLGSGSQLTKRYDGATDRMIVDIDGNAELSTFTISGLPVIGSMSTSDFVLPLNSNFTIRLISGTLKISQNIAVLPGVQVQIDQGAVLQVASGKSLYIYDQSEWGPYAADSAQLVVVGYSTVNGTTTRRTEADLIDAKIDVNGTLEAVGAVYTTASGANIISSEGTGRFVLTNSPGTATTTQQATQSGTSITKVNIPVTPAKLHNGEAYSGTDEEYTLTAGSKSGTIFHYSTTLDKWTDEEETSYTITFVDSDGTVLKTQELPEGAMPTPPEDPTKEADVQYTYTFAGWTPAITAVTGDATYTATYTAMLRSYTVKFINEDGTVLDTQNVPYGSMPEYKGTTPEKETTAQYTYTFSGWTPEITAVTGDTTYTATFTSILRSYTVKFVHEDGTVLETQTLEYGTMPEYKGPTPEKATTDQYTYTFIGWAPELAIVTGDAEYTTVFASTARVFTITWINEDGTVLDTQNVAYGTMPEYKGPTPEKAATAQYTYTFKGWTPEIAAVTSDATYTATFTEELRRYTVKFINEDGTVLETQNVEYGKTPVYGGTTPEKEATAQYTYAFAGWTPEITVVTSDATYTATFTEELRSYTVKFVHEDGAVLDTQTLAYGTIPEYKGATPEKEATTQYTYTFKGWTPEITTVVGDATYTATFTEELRSYTVKFVHEDGTVLDTQTLTYGTMPEYKGATPEKAPTEQYTYTFSGWTPELTIVTGDATYTTVFTAEEAATPEVLRVAGSNRYKTSLKTADELKEELGITKFDSVILATGEAFADALSGSYLSAVKTAPILLIREKDVSTLKAYITDNLTEGGTIYILGGTGAVPEEWIKGFEGYQIKRLSGSSRYTTNLEVLREAGIPEGSEILIATGENFADSLSASSTGKPILLVKKTLSKVQKEFLSELAGKGMHYTILGGTGAVSDELKAEIEACTGATVERISGKTRYETTVMIAERYFPDARSILLATAENYPDGLCAGVLGTVRKAPLILCTNEKTKDATNFCAEREILSGIVFGGAAVLSDETVRTVLNLSEDVEIVVK